MDEQRKAEEWAHEASTTDLIRELIKDSHSEYPDHRFAAAERELDLRIPRRRT